jgi:hypothetical protein
MEVARSKTVPFVKCECGKRGWVEEIEADKALGKAQTKRNRAGDAAGSRRGIKRESRTYLCDVGNVYHLTEQSRRTYQSYSGEPLTALIPKQRMAA